MQLSGGLNATRQPSREQVCIRIHGATAYYDLGYRVVRVVLDDDEKSVGLDNALDADYHAKMAYPWEAVQVPGVKLLL